MLDVVLLYFKMYVPVMNPFFKPCTVRRMNIVPDAFAITWNK